MLGARETVDLFHLSNHASFYISKVRFQFSKDHFLQNIVTRVDYSYQGLIDNSV